MIKVTKRGVNIKNIAVLFIVIFALCFIPNANNIFAQEPYSGTLCNDAINWNLTNGVLTVEGSGEITNGYSSLPWKDYKGSITSISFKGTSETEKISFKGDMHKYFADYSLLESVTFKNIDTSQCEEMYSLFLNCNKLKSVDLSMFDFSSLKTHEETNNTQGFYQMFKNCEELEEVILPAYNPSKQYDNILFVCNMFEECKKLKSVDLSCINFSSVINMGKMFYHCYNIKNIDLITNDTDIVEHEINLEKTFSSCQKLTNIEGLEHFKCNPATLNDTFKNLYAITSLDLSGFDLSSCTSLESTFEECRALEDITFKQCTNDNIISMKSLFKNCYELNTITNFCESYFKPSNMANMFYETKKINNVDLSNFDTSNCTDFSNAFYNCDSLIDLNLGPIYVKSDSTAENMLSGNSFVESLTVKEGAYFANEYKLPFRVYDENKQRLYKLNGTYIKDVTYYTHIYTSFDKYEYYTNKVVDDKGNRVEDITRTSNIELYSDNFYNYFGYLYSDGTLVLTGMWEDGQKNKKFTEAGSWIDTHGNPVSGDIKQIVISKLGFSPTNLDYYFSGLNNPDGVLIDLRELDLTHMEKNTIDHPYDQSNIKQVLMPLNIPDGFIFPMPEDKTWYLYDKNGKLVGEDIENLVAGDGYYALTEKIVTPTPSHKRKKKTNDEVKEESKDSSLINEVKDLIDTSKVAYMTGFSDNTFRPNDYITRAEVSKVISLIKDMFVKNDSDVNYVDNYTDLDNDAWYASYVNDVIASNLMTGDDNGNFNPNSEITRGEIFKIICDLLGISNDEYIPINSMELDGMWYEKYVCLLLNNKLLKGYGDGMFRPSNKITRIELAILINRIQNRMIDNYNDNTLTFSDIDSDYIYYDEIVKASKVIE